MPSLCCARFCKQIVRARINTGRFRSGDVEIFCGSRQVIISDCDEKVNTEKSCKMQRNFVENSIG